RAPYEFGCKVSIATPVTAPKGGQFVLHAKALHGNPYDGHTLGPVIADLEKLTGVTVRRIHGDKGYRGHNYPNQFKVWISGQVRRVTKAIRREMGRRAAIEPVIGHLKEDHRMGRNYLTGRHGDRINAVLAAAGYNFSLLLRWFEELLRVLSLILCHALATPLHLTRCRKTFFTADSLLAATYRGARREADYRRYNHVRKDKAMRKAMRSVGLLSLVLSLFAACAVLRSASAATITVFSNNQPGWVAAVNGSFQTEDFSSPTLVPGLSVTSTNGSVTGGPLSYLLVPGTATTTWSFSTPAIGFGGDWDLSPAGPGTGIQFLLTFLDNTTQLVPAEVPNTFTGQFFGFTSSVPFKSVLESAGTQVGVQET